jgi:hypothetical protein
VGDVEPIRAIIKMNSINECGDDATVHYWAQILYLEHSLHQLFIMAKDEKELNQPSSGTIHRVDFTPTLSAQR